MSAPAAKKGSSGRAATRGGFAGSLAAVKRLEDVSIVDLPRLASGFDEFDRVLGGGFVPGASILIGGHPGAGKSTLLLQTLCRLASSHSALYVTGEESPEQIALRANRLQLPTDQLQLMAETDAAFAGEHSGHYYFRDNYRADSGLIAALLVMQEMSDKQVPLSSLREEFDIYSSTGELNFQVDNPTDVIRRVGDSFSNYDHDLMDGLTVTTDEWWFNLRPSNTEPLLRLNLEAVDEMIMTKELNKISAYLQEFIPPEAKDV